MKIYDLVKKYGIVTRAYPFAPYVVEPHFRGKPQYEYAKCIGCAACGVACPSNAISVKWEQDIKSKIESNMDVDTQSNTQSSPSQINQSEAVIWKYDCGRCIFCGRCDEVCPTGAIRLSGDYELGVRFDKEQLLQVGKIASQKCDNCKQSFSNVRLIAYAREVMEHSNIFKERLEEAKSYQNLCQKCRRDKTLKTMIKQEFGAVK